MDENRNLKLMAVSLAVNATVVYFSIPALMSIEPFAAFAERFIVHPVQPLITAFAVGAFIGLLAATTYFFYALLKELV